jgi:hypothetical protein
MAIDGKHFNEPKIKIVRIDKQCKKQKSTLHAMAKNPTSQNCNGKKLDVQKYFVKIAICINMIHHNLGTACNVVHTNGPKLILHRLM